MIDALIEGRLHRKPGERIAKNGNRFVTCKVRAVTHEGEASFVDVISFQAPVVTALLSLDDGDAVAVSGELTLKVWTDREGTARPSAGLLAHRVTSTYHVQRKRQVLADADDPSEEAPERQKAG